MQSARMLFCRAASRNLWLHLEWMSGRVHCFVVNNLSSTTKKLSRWPQTKPKEERCGILMVLCWNQLHGSDDRLVNYKWQLQPMAWWWKTKWYQKLDTANKISQIIKDKGITLKGQGGIYIWRSTIWSSSLGLHKTGWIRLEWVWPEWRASGQQWCTDALTIMSSWMSWAIEPPACHFPPYPQLALWRSQMLTKESLME